MAASGVRLTMKFNLNMGLHVCGWSESYDLMEANLSAAINDLKRIQNFISLRANCLGAGVEIVGLSLIPDAGGAIIPPVPRRVGYDLPIPNVYGSIDAFSYNKDLGSFPADYGTSVLYFNCSTDPTATPVYRRSIWMAGIPDAADSTNLLKPGEGAWNKAFNAFAAGIGINFGSKFLGQGLIGIRSIDQSNANPLKQCTNYDPTNGLFTANNHGFVTGQLIVATGFKSINAGPVPKGYYKCTRVSDDTLFLQQAVKASITPPPGAFRAVKYVWNPITDCDLDGFSKRNKGRPFGAPVGRRRAPRIKRV